MAEPVKRTNLKNIVDNLNKMIYSDYNLSSFDAISENALLGIVVLVLQKYELLDSDVNHTAAPVMILNVLKAIKYVPENEISPDDFRTGLNEAVKEIIYPILTFLLENEANIKKRFYLSKYVLNIEVPPDIFVNDENMQNLYKVYQHTIDTFWMIYSENKHERILSKETSELEGDIFQMKSELNNLEKRIDTQYNKAKLSENYLEGTREFVREKKKYEKLSEQLEGDKLLLQKYIDTIRKYNRRDKIYKLQDLLEKSEYYADAHQVYLMSAKEINDDLNIFEKVAAESCADDLQQLEKNQETLKQTVNKLHTEKLQDDAICVMQNQQRILAKKKSLLAKQVIKIRLYNDQVLNKIDELCQIMGGEILRGQTFKNYVCDLKAMSNTYKRNKCFIKSLENEEIILKQTLQQLFEFEPNLKCNIKNTCDGTPVEIRKLSLDDIRIKTLILYTEHNLILKTCYEDEEKYQKVKDLFSENLMQFDKMRHAFIEETGNLMDCIECLTIENKKIQSLLSLEKEDLQMQENESEILQDNLLRYSQMFIDNAGDVGTQDILNHKLSLSHKMLNELRVQADLRQQASQVVEQEKITIKGITTLIRDGKLFEFNI